MNDDESDPCWTCGGRGCPDCLECICGDTFNPKCPEHGGNEHRP